MTLVLPEQQLDVSRLARRLGHATQFARSRHPVGPGEALGTGRAATGRGGGGPRRRTAAFQAIYSNCREETTRGNVARSVGEERGKNGSGWRGIARRTVSIAEAGEIVARFR